jgi:hypothetical protein
VIAGAQESVSRNLGSLVRCPVRTHGCHFTDHDLGGDNYQRRDPTGQIGAFSTGSNASNNTSR